MRTTRGNIRPGPVVALAAAIVCACGATAIAQNSQTAGPPTPERSESTSISGQDRSARTFGDLLLSGGTAADRQSSEPPRGDNSVSQVPVTPSDTESRPLGAARSSQQGDRGLVAAPTSGPSVMDGWIGRTVMALAFVIGLAVVLRSVVRRAGRAGGGLGSQLGAGGKAPSGVLLVLGRYPISRGQTLVLLKVDRRILLLSQSPQGFQTLSEITDPEEVASLLIRTRDEAGESMSQRFSALLRRIERDPAISDGAPSPASRLVELKDDDSWPARERWGGGGDEQDPIRVLRRRLESLSGSAS